jgi:gliding motility-associated-like protein
MSMNFSLKTIILISFFTLINTYINAQNLVPNGDFEEYSELPNFLGQINRAVGWNNLNGEYVFFTNKGSPDYHHSNSWHFAAAPEPFSGKAQAGLITYTTLGELREYISTSFTTPLITGKKYKLSFYLSNGNYALAGTTYLSNGFGATFSMSPLSQLFREPVIANSQVFCKEIVSAFGVWEYFTFVFTAEEAYQFIAFGNFNNDQNTLIGPFGAMGAYYYIDKVELVEMNYNLCIGDTIELEHFSRDSSYAWALAESPNEILSNDKTLKVSPSISTTYLLFTGVDTISFPVIIVHPLQSVIEHQQPICQGKPLLLNAGNSGASFLWQDQSTNSTFQVTQPGYYYVEISNACGTITDTVRVDTNCVALLEMPNVFTPNGDGINDLFIPIKTQQINNLTFSIYNRWGNQIAEIKPNMIGWDGKNGGESCPEDVYFWLAIYSDKSGMRYSQKGFVQLIR